MSDEVRIGRFAVGEGHPVYVIGEIGLNHNGSVDIAKQLIDEGRLVVLGDDPAERNTERAHWLVQADEALRAEVLAVAQWVIDEAARDGASEGA